MNTNVSPSIFSLLSDYKSKISLSTALEIIATIIGLIPFIVVYRLAIALFNPPILQSSAWQLIAVALIAVVIKWVLIAIAGSLSHIVAYDVLYDVRRKISDKFGVLPLGYFDKHSTGELKKIMNEDVEYLELTIAHGIPEVIGLLSTLVITSIYLFTVDWRMTLAALSGVPLLILGQAIMFRRSLPLVQEYYATKDRMNSTIIEYVRGMPVIKAFTQTTESFAKYADSVGNYQKYEEEWAKITLFPLTLTAISATFNLLVLLPVGIWLWQTGSLSLPTLILFLLIGLGICAPLVKLMESISIYVQTQEGLKRIGAILNEPALKEPEKSDIPQDLTIEFQQVNFSYQDKQVLTDINLVIPQGHKVALVGASGSGKTTITRLIGRFWDVDSGSISLGGINLKHFKLADLMANFAFVFQEVVLFEDTVLANIRLGKPKARGAEVIEAAKAARCHEFITAMPNGYQTNIGDRGAKLSGGQKQRIAIARAILKDAPIVILDEATAFIDSENEALIQEAISALVRDKTLIVIAHRLSTITEVDRIFVVNEGEITASGTHPELLDTSQLYRQMWTAHLAAQDWVFASQQPAYQTYLD